jgi:hypothetical protein
LGDCLRDRRSVLLEDPLDPASELP